MNTDTLLIPAAPYRVLEALWNFDLIGSKPETEFPFPYEKTKSCRINNSLAELSLEELTGTRLAFSFSGKGQNQIASILIEGMAYRKNETKLGIQVISTTGESEKAIMNWLFGLAEEIGARFSAERKAA